MPFSSLFRLHVISTTMREIGDVLEVPVWRVVEDLMSRDSQFPILSAVTRWDIVESPLTMFAFSSIDSIFTLFETICYYASVLI